MSSTANTLAEDHMFEISNKTQILDRDTKAYFHKMTANLTFFTKKFSSNLLDAVAFLTTILK